MKNKYETVGDITILYCKNTKGKVYPVLIDTEDLDYVSDVGDFWNVSNTGDSVILFTPDKNRVNLGDHIAGKYQPGATVVYANKSGLDNRKSNLSVSVSLKASLGASKHD